MITSNSGRFTLFLSDTGYSESLDICRDAGLVSAKIRNVEDFNEIIEVISDANSQDGVNITGVWIGAERVNSRFQANAFAFEDSLLIREGDFVIDADIGEFPWAPGEPPKVTDFDCVQLSLLAEDSAFLFSSLCEDVSFATICHEPTILDTVSMNTTQGREFMLIKGDFFAQSAQVECEKHGLTLAKITSSQDYIELQQFLSIEGSTDAVGPYVGIEKEKTNDPDPADFFFTDAFLNAEENAFLSQKEISDFPWGNGRPDRTNQGCVDMRRNLEYRLSDTPCANTRKEALCSQPTLLDDKLVTIGPFSLSNQLVPFSEASSFCSSMGLTLATITERENFETLRFNLGKFFDADINEGAEGTWIGLELQDTVAVNEITPSSFRFSEDTLLTINNDSNFILSASVGENPWGVDEPSSDISSACVELTSGKVLLRNVGCSKQNLVLCTQPLFQSGNQINASGLNIYAATGAFLTLSVLIFFVMLLRRKYEKLRSTKSDLVLYGFDVGKDFKGSEDKWVDAL